jgi:regulator of nucleoside diphosphate kinase
MKKNMPLTLPMTEQEARRLESVARLFSDVDAEGARRLREQLGRAKLSPASKIPRSTVTMNSRVICRDAAEREHEVSLVYPWDAGGSRISVLSARGAALLGASIGTELHEGGPALVVASIPYQPEAAGDHHL